MRVRFASRFLVVALAVVGLGWSAPEAAVAEEKLDKAAASKGDTIFKRYCVACHGRSGKGDGSLSKELRTTVPDITLLSEKNKGVFPFEKVVKMVDGRETSRSHGTPDMPAWGDAFEKTDGKGTKTVDEAINRLTHFIWSLQKPPSTK